MSPQGTATPPKVFISYAREDWPAAQRLYNALKTAGADPWLDRKQILPGQLWRKTIRNAISQSDFFLALLSENSVNKTGFVQKELKVALELLDELPNEKIFFIPARLDDCKPGRIDKLQRVDLFPSFDDGFKQILRALQLEAPVPSRVELVGGVEIQFVLIPPGSFPMGSETGEDDEKPVRTVKITREFELGKYPVTQRQWQALMGELPSCFEGCDHPVEQVSWNDVQKFLQKLNAGQDGFDYTLPSEAEWEYAARAGTTGDYPGDLDEIAWYGKSSDAGTSPVGEGRKPNRWGLYDMCGNVWEWVQDFYQGNYYGLQPDPNIDPIGPVSGGNRVIRGGSWLYPASNCRCAYRNYNPPEEKTHDLGFRLLRRSKNSER